MCLFSFLSTFVLSGNVSILPIDQLFTWPNSSTSIELEMGPRHRLGQRKQNDCQPTKDGRTGLSEAKHF